MNDKAGFTLIDLLVAVAIIGIVIGVGIPSFNTMITNNRLTTYANGMVRGLNLARSEASKQNYWVAICKSSYVTQQCDNSRSWNDGWIVFVDKDNDQVVDAGEEVVYAFEELGSNYFYKSSYVNYISYRPDGRSNMNGNFRVCSPRSSSGFRKIIISDTGRVRTQNDTDKNYDNSTYNSACVV